jgi:hypothetical protein
MENLNLEYIIENIYNEEEQKKGFFNFLNPKNWMMFSDLLQNFSVLSKYKQDIKDLLKNKSMEYQKLITLFSTVEKKDPNKLAKIISELIKNEAQNNGLKISEPLLILKNIFSSKNVIGNLLSFFNTATQKIKQLEPSQLGSNESFSINDDDIVYLSESILHQIKRIEYLEIINEVKTIKKSKVSSKTIITIKEVEKAGEFISTLNQKSFGSANAKRYKGPKKFFIFLLLILIALIKSMGSLSAGGLTGQDKADIKDYAFKVALGDDIEQSKILGDDIKTSEDTIKNIKNLIDDKEKLEKKLSEKEGTFKGKFNIGDTGKEIKQLKSDIEAFKKAISSFGDVNKIQKSLNDKKIELDKVNQKIDSKQGIAKYLVGDDFGKIVSDQEVKDEITKQLNKQSIEFLNQGNETLKLATEAKTGLFNQTLDDLQLKNSELKNASSESKADVVSKYLEEVSKGKIDDQKAKVGLDSIKKLEIKADNFKKAGFATSEKKITTKDLEVFAKKNLAQQVSSILNSDNPAEYKITYTYDSKTGEVKIDTSTDDYKTLEQNLKILKNDPLFKNFNQTFKQTISKISGDVNKLAKSLEKLQELKTQKTDLEGKLQKATDKDKPQIQEKINKIEVESKKVSGDQDPYSVDIGLQALQDLADSKNITIEDAIKIYKGFELQNQIDVKIMAASNSAEMKSLGITDANEFKDYKSLSSDKTNNWSAEDNKTFVNIMKYNEVKFSDIKKAMSDPEVKKIMNGKLWDIKDSSGKYKISNEVTQEFKKLIEQKTAPKTTGEVKKVDTKTSETKNTDTKTNDAKKTDNKNSTAQEVSPEESIKKLTPDEKQNVKDNIKLYKDHIQKSSDPNKIQEKKNYEKMASNNFNDIKKLVFANTGYSDSEIKSFISDPTNLPLFESKKDVKDLFSIFEQNYFKK